MRIFQGPLGNHRNYIEYIVFPNCIDYLRLVEKHKDENRDKTPDKYTRLRFFLNAIESLNNIPEYYFHDNKDEKNWESKNLSNILGKIRKKHTILQDLEQIANAYKHCVRHKAKNIQANDLQSSSISISISSEKWKTHFLFDSVENESLLAEAFRFWKSYLDNEVELI